MERVNPKFKEPLENDPNKCSFEQCGRHYVRQHYYRCKTCGLTKGYSICETCAKKCHAGHELIDAGYGRCFCDCGASCAPFTCKCCAPIQVCTNVNGKNETVDQRLWRCLTCDPNEEYYICNACKERCHSNHDVVDCGVIKGYCECYQHGFNCKARKEVSKEIRKPKEMKEISSQTVEQRTEKFSIASNNLENLFRLAKSLPVYRSHIFSIIINDKIVIKLPVIVASFLSSAVTSILETDSTSTELRVNIDVPKDLENVLDKIKGVIESSDEVELSDINEIEIFADFGAKIGNEEFKRPLLELINSSKYLIDKDNVMFSLNRMIKIGNTNLDREIEFIAKNFEEMSKNADFISFAMNPNNIDIIEAIISNENIYMESEDTLLSFLLLISKENRENTTYLRLFDYVYLEYCSVDLCNQLLCFISDIIPIQNIKTVISCIGRRLLQQQIPMTPNFDKNRHRKRDEQVHKRVKR